MNKIVEITTPTCTVCKMLKPMLEMVLNKNFTDLKMDVYDHESDEGKKYVEKYSIKSVPAFFFIKNDEVVDTHFGSISPVVFKEKCEKIVD